MSSFLLIAPVDWELATPEQLQAVIDNVGNIEGISSMIAAGQIGEIWGMIDPIRSNSENIENVMLIDGQLWFKVI